MEKEDVNFEAQFEIKVNFTVVLNSDGKILEMKNSFYCQK
jgi:hypothetical protein